MPWTAPVSADGVIDVRPTFPLLEALRMPSRGTALLSRLGRVTFASCAGRRWESRRHSIGMSRPLAVKITACNKIREITTNISKPQTGSGNRNYAIFQTRIGTPCPCAEEHGIFSPPLPPCCSSSWRSPDSPSPSRLTKRRVTTGNATIRDGRLASAPDLALGLPRLSLEAA
jgi:hypothetical protein